MKQKRKRVSRIAASTKRMSGPKVLTLSTTLQPTQLAQNELPG